MVLNPLAPTWNLIGAFIQKHTNFWLHCIVQTVLTIDYNKPHMCNRNYIESKIKLVFVYFYIKLSGVPIQKL